MDKSNKVRLEAVRAIGEIGCRGISNVDILSVEIEKLLIDTDTEIVAAAARTLGEINSVSSAGTLTRISENTNDTIKSEAVQALASLDSAETTCPLLARIKVWDHKSYPEPEANPIFPLSIAVNPMAGSVILSYPEFDAFSRD